jgi:rhamnosyltransferase
LLPAIIDIQSTSAYTFWWNRQERRHIDQYGATMDGKPLISTDISQPYRVNRADSQVCAVVVTYFPDERCAENLEHLSPQVGDLLIVDNGSSTQSLEPVEIAAHRLRATIIRLGSNLGIAAALNVGLAYAREHGYQWLATFDQDSQATSGMIAEMFRVLSSFPGAGQVAVLAPCPIDEHLDVDLRYPGAQAVGTEWRVIPCAGTSGNLVNVQAASIVGGFDNSLFIDYVDFDFCLRLRRLGYQILEVTRARLLHSLGRMELRLLVFRRVPVTNHSALRRYYMSRNRLILWLQYWNRESAWVIRDVGWFLRETFYIVLFEAEVKAKIRMVVHGLIDGLKNVRGAYQPRR